MKLDDPQEQAALAVSSVEEQLGRSLDASEREILRRIVRLRRNLSPQEDFPEFARLVEENLASVLCWPLRWRVSVLDTFTDCGDDVLSRNAHLIVSVVNLTRLAEVDKLYRYRPRRWLLARHMKRVAERRPELPWLVDLSLPKGDISTNLIRRTERALEATPLLEPFWAGIMRELVLHDDSPTFWSLFAGTNRLFERWVNEDLFGGGPDPS